MRSLTLAESRARRKVNDKTRYKPTQAEKKATRRSSPPSPSVNRSNVLFRLLDPARSGQNCEAASRARRGEGRVGGGRREGNRTRALAPASSRQMGEAMRVVSVKVQGCEAMAEKRGGEVVTERGGSRSTRRKASETASSSSPLRQPPTTLPALDDAVHKIRSRRPKNPSAAFLSRRLIANFPCPSSAATKVKNRLIE
ncbi:hypothetical protein BJY59DRAFT_327729 [Rhodotorula toruloides]